MNQKITFGTLKGGTGKTMLSVACIRWIAAHEISVVGIDFDTQGTLTSHFLIDDECRKSIVQAIVNSDLEANIERKTNFISIVPASTQSDMIRGMGYNEVRSLLEQIQDEDKFVIIDTGRGTENPNISAAQASDILVTPISASLGDIEATNQFISFLNRTIDTPPIKIILNKFPKDNSKFQYEYEQRINTVFKDHTILSPPIKTSRHIVRAMDENETIRPIKKMQSIYNALNTLFEQITGLPALSNTRF